jgi:tyrosyl-tRNA synthetase
MMAMAWLQRAGHRPIALAGGGTGFIGDPGGKTEERALLSREDLERNCAAIQRILGRFLDFDSTDGALLVNNADWLCPVTLINFLRDVGKHFTVNTMLEKESVRARLEDRRHGISFTEFSYMLLQAYDFLHLYDHHNCRLQVGGSDQFGNITAGCELIRRRNSQSPAAEHGPAYGLTWPLLMRSDGKKFGKTEAGAVWLSADRTSPYEFYQYWLNIPDTEVETCLRQFTDLPREEIEELVKRTRQTPEKREGQRTLARCLTDLTHGTGEREKAERAGSALFSGVGVGAGLAELDEKSLLDAVKQAPSAALPRARLDGAGVPALDLMVESGLWSSRGEAKKALPAGGVYLNGLRLADLSRRVVAGDLLHGRYLVLRKGKKDHFLFRVE